MDGNCPGWELSGMGIDRWELSGMGNVRDGNCPVGIVRDGKCPGWELSGGNCPGWELSGMGIVRDGNCPGWELSGMGTVRDGNCPGIAGLVSKDQRMLFILSSSHLSKVFLCFVCVAGCQCWNGEWSCEQRQPQHCRRWQGRVKVLMGAFIFLFYYRLQQIWCSSSRIPGGCWNCLLWNHQRLKPEWGHH